MFQPPRGTRDFLPEEMLKRNWVLDRIRSVYESYGFEPLGTPAFESLELLKVKSGEEVIDQIYHFKDKSDRDLGLRFEWTASLARVVASHRELTMPFKRYQLGPVWRYENPSEKRFREFVQCDADTVGVADPLADAEILAAAVDCLQALGFEGFVIRLNDRRILRALIEKAGMPTEFASEIIRAVDKLEKIGRGEVLKEMSRYVSDNAAATKLLEWLSLKGEPEEVLKEVRGLLGDTEAGLNGCVALEAIAEYSASYGYREYLTVDLSLARGLDYYTGPVFEVFAKGHEDYGSIAGGGRYDELIGLFGGEPTPATGIALGFERIVLLLEEKGVFAGLGLGAEVLVSHIGDNTQPEAISLAQELRRGGVPTLTDLMSRNLRKQLDYAAKKGVRRVVIVGERELAEGCVTLRDMASGEQRKVKRGELLGLLRS